MGAMTIRLLSFNIRCSAAQDGPNRWEARRGLVVERIRAFDPDLIGMQECEDNAQAEFIRASLPDYGFLGVRRSSNPGPGLEMMPVLYRLAAFDLLDQGVFWLSKTPDVPGSLDWKAVFPRTVLWQRLRQKPSGFEFVFFNTHFDYASPQAQLRSAELLHQRMQTIAGGAPCLLTGDFNASKTSPPYTRLTAGSFLRDAVRQLGVSGTTFHDFGRQADQPGGPNEIDWILAAPQFTPILASIDRTHPAEVWPSDHYPVGVVFN